MGKTDSQKNFSVEWDFWNVQRTQAEKWGTCFQDEWGTNSLRKFSHHLSWKTYPLFFCWSSESVTLTLRCGDLERSELEF